MTDTSHWHITIPIIRIILSARIYTSHDSLNCVSKKILGGVPNNWKQGDSFHERFSSDDDGND